MEDEEDEEDDDDDDDAGDGVLSAVAAMIGLIVAGDEDDEEGCDDDWCGVSLSRAMVATEECLKAMCVVNASFSLKERLHS